MKHESNAYKNTTKWSKDMRTDRCAEHTGALKPKRNTQQTNAQNGRKAKKHLQLFITG